MLRFSTVPSKKILRKHFQFYEFVRHTGRLLILRHIVASLLTKLDVCPRKPTKFRWCFPQISLINKSGTAQVGAISKAQN